MEKRSTRTAISPIVATVLIIAATLIAAAAIIGFVFGVVGGAAGVQVGLTPEIYRSGSNIGILNQQANFTVSIRNNLETPQNVTLVVLDSGRQVQAAHFEVGKLQTTNRIISQELIDVGYWTVEVQVNGTVIPPSYSFQVVTNAQEADFQINQYGIATQSNNLAIAALIVSVISATMAAAAYLRPRSPR